MSGASARRDFGERGRPLSQSEVSAIRADFPTLNLEVNGRAINYLDSAATALKPRSVLDAEREFQIGHTSAVHRGAHTLAAQATELFEDARVAVARFVGARDDEIVWTSNATEGLNLVAYAISNASLGRGGPQAERFRLGPGDEIVVTEMEHHANLTPWFELAARTGASMRFIGLDDDGSLRQQDIYEIICERTRILAFTHVSNVLGTINPVHQLVQRANEVGALTVLDACQSVPNRAVDLVGLGVDFAVFSGHKMLGPTGIGALFGRSELLNALPPFLTGGSMITTVTMESVEYLPAPLRFEAGTQRVSQAIALAAAVSYLDRVGLDRIAAHERRLAARMLDGLATVERVQVLGPPAGVDRAGLVSFDIDGVHAHDVGQFLDDRGIAVRVGHHCAQPLHRRFGLTASTRASSYLYTTDAEVDEFVSRIRDVPAYFGLVP